MNTEIQKEIEELAKRIELEPNNSKLHHKLADLYNKVGNYQKSEEAAYKALEFETENPDYLVSYGNSLAWLEKYEEAIGYISKGIEKNKSTLLQDYIGGKCYICRGNCYQRLNEKIINEGDNENREGYIKSLSDFNRAIELEPNNAEYYYCRGISYGWIGDFEKSHEDYKKALELSPENGSYLSEFAITANKIEIYIGINSNIRFEEELLNNPIEKVKEIRAKLGYLPYVHFMDDPKLKAYEICVSIGGKVIFHKDSLKETFESNLCTSIDYLEKLYLRNVG